MKSTLVDWPFPSKEYHKKLSQVDESSFNSGSLWDIGNSKNVYEQIKHEDLKRKQKHENIFISIKNLKTNIYHSLIITNLKGLLNFSAYRHLLLFFGLERILTCFFIMQNNMRLWETQQGALLLKPEPKWICTRLLFCVI